MTVISPFDYARLGAVASDFQEAAVTIRRISTTGAIEIGTLLNELKDKAKHGTFSAWVTSELQIQMRTAQNMMAAASFVEGKSETVSLLPPTLLYKLASPSTDQNIVNDVVETAAAGEPVDAAKINARITVARDAEREADNLFNRYKNEGKKKKKAEHVAQRVEEQDRYYEKRQKQQAQLRPIAAEIVAALPEKMRKRLRQENNYAARHDFVELLTEELERQTFESAEVTQ